MTHGRVEEADAILSHIESGFCPVPHETLPVIRLRTRRFTPLAEVAATLFRAERQRTLVGLALMVAQAFFYNAIFFGRRAMISATYALSGLLLAVAGYFFAIGILSATGQTTAWMVIFFFASAAH